jgi:hypothetical protein
MEKGFFAAVVAVFAGYVGYKIIQKKNPEIFRKVEKSIASAGKKMSAILDEAKESFHAGYAQG